jgi:nicotinate-nucleotide pyrophosphorylase (carboxylating)
MQLTTEQQELIDQLIRLALREDIGDGDHTSLACIPSEVQQKARLLVKDTGILSGVTIAQRVAEFVDPKLQFDLKISDGSAISPGDVAFYITGSARSILTAERLMLNIMQRMSGIATNTNRLVSMVKQTGVTLLDTRKTGPGMRVMEKLAVFHGGGKNHRMGLYDMVMIKDNHADYAGGVAQAIRNVKAYLSEKHLNLDIEVESRNLEDVKSILQEGGVRRIMFDNFTPDLIREALKITQNQVETEASGGINEQNLLEYAQTGVQFISIGALTHQVKSLDLSLKAC